MKAAVNEPKPRGGKNIRAARKQFDKTKYYNLDEAIEALKQVSYTNFDETLEVVFKLGVDPRHSDQLIRGVTNLPAGTGKDVRVAVICKDEKQSEAKNAGADLVGSDEIIQNIKSGNIDFDVCIATPDMMASIGQVARILGPKGLMPNPKLGTVTTDIENAVKNAKSGQVEYRVDKNGVIHAGIGKLSFDKESLKSNFSAIYDAMIKAKPQSAKGTYMKGIYLSSSMGPSAKIDKNTLVS